MSDQARGFSDRLPCHQTTEDEVRTYKHLGNPSLQNSITCAVEFEALTPYHYPPTKRESEVRPSETESDDFRWWS